MKYLAKKEVDNTVRRAKRLRNLMKDLEKKYFDIKFPTSVPIDYNSKAYEELNLLYEVIQWWL